jgi:hypothetical protein
MRRNPMACEKIRQFLPHFFTRRGERRVANGLFARHPVGSRFFT